MKELNTYKVKVKSPGVVNTVGPRSAENLDEYINSEDGVIYVTCERPSQVAHVVYHEDIISIERIGCGYIP